jgi:type I site-specific restriction endonuclease
MPITLSAAPAKIQRSPTLGEHGSVSDRGDELAQTGGIKVGSLLGALGRAPEADRRASDPNTPNRMINDEKHDCTRSRDQDAVQIKTGQFPSPNDLWGKYRTWKGLTPDEEQIVLQDYFDDASGKAPRYYQVNAVNAAIEAIAKGQDRVLLVMATGTGKTYTTFQIIWRLWKAGRKKRILFLADRNVLVDQTMVNDFRPFGAAMAKLSTGAKTIEREDGSEVEVYLGLY